VDPVHELACCRALLRVRDICHQRKEILNLAVVFRRLIARSEWGTPALERLMQNV
jgi:hypothetical protein